MGAGFEHGVPAKIIELNHAGTRRLKHVLRASAVAVSRGDESRAQRLRQYQLVARPGVGVGDDLLWMDDTRDCQAKFDLGVAHRVPAYDDRAGRLTALGAAA